MSPTVRTVAAYVATLVTFVALDFLWLSQVAIGQFQAAIGGILKPQPDLVPAAAFYLIYAGGLVALAINPALQAASAKSALIKGAILGLTAYATFDLTSLSIIKGWPASLALLDMSWGTAASSLAALAGYLTGNRLR